MHYMIFMHFSQALVVLQMLGFIFVPIYITSGVGSSKSRQWSTFFTLQFILGCHNAGISFKTFWREKTQGFHCNFIAYSLHFHESVGNYLFVDFQNLYLKMMCICTNW